MGLELLIIPGSPPLKKGVTLAIFKAYGKTPYFKDFSNTETPTGALQLYKKETLTQLFSCEFCKIFKNTFFTEHLWATVSANKYLRG